MDTPIPEQREYKYDVAFSFLAKDEALATELNDLLQERYRTFVYSKRQEELAGTDGERTFNAVFGAEARLVVVLYRSGWGQTPWTRIEETAIRNRAFNEGYEFVKFMPLDDDPSVPAWLPKTQIWIGLNRWGVPAAVGVIDARIQELGGHSAEESVTDRAVRLKRAINLVERRKEFRQSHAGVQTALQEFVALQAKIEEIVHALQSNGSLDVTFKAKSRSLAVGGMVLVFFIIRSYLFGMAVEL